MNLEEALAYADRCVPCTDSQRALKALAEEVRSLRPDARRYRWLKAHTKRTGDLITGDSPLPAFMKNYEKWMPAPKSTPEEADSAIDDLIAGEDAQ